jgi:hypothetical protein
MVPQGDTGAFLAAAVAAASAHAQPCLRGVLRDRLPQRKGCLSPDSPAPDHPLRPPGTSPKSTHGGILARRDADVNLERGDRFIERGFVATFFGIPRKRISSGRAQVAVPCVLPGTEAPRKGRGGGVRRVGVRRMVPRDERGTNTLLERCPLTAGGEVKCSATAKGGPQSGM